MTTKKPFRAKMFGGKIEFQVPAAWFNYSVELDALERRFTDMRPVFEMFGGYMLESIRRTHEAEGRPAKWQPLALSTQLDRARHGFPPAHPILKRTGAMKSAYTYKYTKNTFWLDNPTAYFKFHQKGTKKMPQRIVIQLLAQDKAQFTKIRGQYIRGELGFF